MEGSPWCCCLGRSLVAFPTVTPVGPALSLPSPFKTPAPSAQTSRTSALSPAVSGYRIKQAFPASTNVWWFGFDPARSFPSICFYLEQGMCHRGGRAAAHSSLPFLFFFFTPVFETKFRTGECRGPDGAPGPHAYSLSFPTPDADSRAPGCPPHGPHRPGCPPYDGHKAAPRERREAGS